MAGANYPDVNTLAVLLAIWFLRDVRRRLQKIEKFLWPHQGMNGLKADRRSPYKVVPRWEERDLSDR